MSGDRQFKPFVNHGWRGVLEMQDAPREIRLRLGGCMDEEWAHHQDASLRNNALHSRIQCGELMNRLVGQNATGVSSGQYSEWPVARG